MRGSGKDLALYASRPDLETELTYMRSAAQLAALRSGELHLGLLYGAGDLDGHGVEPLFPGEPAAVYAAIETHARLWGSPGGVGRPGWAVAADPRHVPVLRRLGRGA